MSILVRRLEEVPGGADAVGRVYRAAFRDERNGARADFVTAQLAVHAERDGFDFAGVVDGGRLVGFGYGYTGREGQYWTDRVAKLAPAEVAGTWIGGHFELAELGVLPSARGHGVGAAVLEALTAARPEPRALLTTWQPEHPARRLYERHGWVELVHRLDRSSSLYGLDLTARDAR